MGLRGNVLFDDAGDETQSQVMIRVALLSVFRYTVIVFCPLEVNDDFV